MTGIQDWVGCQAVANALVPSLFRSPPLLKLTKAEFLRVDSSHFSRRRR